MSTVGSKKKLKEFENDYLLTIHAFRVAMHLLSLFVQKTSGILALLRHFYELKVERPRFGTKYSYIKATILRVARLLSGAPIKSSSFICM